MHCMRLMINFLPLSARATLVNALHLSLSLLDYAVVAFSNATEVQLDRLERLQNHCIFLYTYQVIIISINKICGLRKYDHVSSFRAQLKWLDIKECWRIHIIGFLFNILNDVEEKSYYMDPPTLSDIQSLKYYINLCTEDHIFSFQQLFTRQAGYSDSFTIIAIRL